MRPELSVVLPCRDEAATVEGCIAEAWELIRREGVAGEVIVADNGSRDGSGALARGAGARVVEVSAPGYGRSLRAGLEAARGRWVVMGDADGSYDFRAAAALLELLRGGADLALGNRFAGGIEAGAMPWLHERVGNPLMTRMARLLFGVPLGDVHCGLRALRRGAWPIIDARAPGFEFASELVLRAQLAGLTLAEAPTPLRRDGRGRRPHLRTFRDGLRHLWLRLSLRPELAAGLGGACLLAAALGAPGAAGLAGAGAGLGVTAALWRRRLDASAWPPSWGRRCAALSELLIFGGASEALLASEGWRDGAAAVMLAALTASLAWGPWRWRRDGGWGAAEERGDESVRGAAGDDAAGLAGRCAAGRGGGPLAAVDEVGER